MRWGLDFCCWQLREGELGKFGLVASVSLSRFLPRFFFFEGVYFGAGSIRPYQSQLRNMALLLCGFM